MRKISRKKRFRVLAVLLILGGVVAYLHWPVPVKIIISPETTRITGTLNPDGTINYVAALNAMTSEGVTPDNNAAIPLIQAFGPDIFPDEIREEVLRTLNLSSLPVKGDYFVALEDHVKTDLPKEKFKPRSASLRAEISPSSEAAEQADEDLAAALEQPWSAEEYPIIAGWLKANEKPLATVISATRRPRYYMPLVSTSQPPQVVETLLPSLGCFKEVARALTARAMLKVDSGDIEGAWADIMTTYRLARLISQDSILIGRLVGVAIETLACQAAETVATCGKPTAKQAKAFLTDLESLPPLPDIVETIDQGERFAMLDCIMMMWRSGESELDDALGIEHPKVIAARRRIDWNEPLRAFNYWFDRIVEAHSKPTFAERKEASVAFSNDLSQLAAQMSGASFRVKFVLKRLAGRAMRKSFSRDMANLLVNILVPTLGRACELHGEAVMRFRLTRLAMALAAYKARSGNYPDKLDALVPAYLKIIPDDLFMDKPLKYERRGNGYLLYSLGRNMKDDGGSDDRDTEHDDISVCAAGGNE